MTRKIPISFSDETYNKVREIVTLMGITNVYGDFPKALKFSINLALSAIRNPEKVYNELDRENMEYYFKSIINSETLKNKRLELEKVQKEMEKV